MKRYTAALSLFVLLQLLSFAVFAGTLKGRVTDTKNNILPYATLYIQGTTIGVSTSADGNYELNLAAGSYKVICQYIGYKQSVYTITIGADQTITHDFKLQDQALEMKEVVIHASGEDPAYGIIRKVIARRVFHLEQVHSFQTGIYLKGVIRTRSVPDKIMGQKVSPADLGVDTAGKGILYLCEEDADYYASGNKERTVIHSVRESGNPNGYGLSQFPPVVTFYENNINLFAGNPRGFISPISDNALNFYKYKLEGTFQENGRTIYKIKIIPKRLYEPVFNGIIYIVDEDWSIQSLDMYVTKKSDLNFLDTLQVKQLFLPLKKDTWVAKSQVVAFSFGIIGFEGAGSLATVYDHQKVNEPIPDTIFNKKIISSYDKTANKKDTVYWQYVRPIPLESDEMKDFLVKDSVLQHLQDPDYIDSVRIAQNAVKVMSFLAGGSEFNTKSYKDHLELNPLLLGMVNYNTVEGLNIAPKLDWRHKLDTGRYIQGAVAVRYGFHNTHLNAIGRLEYATEDNSWKGRSWLFGAEGGKYVFQYNPMNPVIPIMNTVSALLWRENDLKIYERWDAAAYVRRNYGNGFTWDIKLAYQHRIPLENTTDFSFYKKTENDFGSNVPPHLREVTVWEEHDAVLAHIGLTYRPGYVYTQYPDYKIGNSNWPLFSLTYNKGIPDILNSKVNFDKWRFAIEGNARLKLLGSLAYNVAVGGFLNNEYVSIPDLMHLYGNRGIGFASAYLHSFQFAQYYDFSNKEPLYGEVHLEYNLQGLLSNKIPLLKKARWYLLMGTNTFYATPNDYYTEAFIGIDNLGVKMFRFLRIDFVQSWDSNGGRNSGIRVGINTNGLLSIKIKNETGEW